MRPLMNTLSPRLGDLLDARVVKRLQAISTNVAYADGQLIHSRGDDKPGVSIVRDGAVHVGSYGQDGSFVTTSVFGPGQCFGEHTIFAGLPRTHDVFAVGPTRVDQINGADFLAVFNEEPMLGRALLIVSQVRTHILVEQLDDMRRLPLKVRAAKFLLGAPREAKAGAVLVVTRQSDMAFALGVSRVSMGKVLKSLHDAGLVSLGYGRILLPDVARLETWVAARSAVVPLRAKLPPAG